MAEHRQHRHHHARQPVFQLVGLVLAWRLFGYVWGPIFRGALNLLYPGVTYA